MDVKMLRRALVVVQASDRSRCHWSCSWAHEAAHPNAPEGFACVLDLSGKTSERCENGKRTKYCLASGSEVETR